MSAQPLQQFQYSTSTIPFDSIPCTRHDLFRCNRHSTSIMSFYFIHIFDLLPHAHTPPPTGYRRIPPCSRSALQCQACKYLSVRTPRSNLVGEIGSWSDQVLANKPPPIIESDKARICQFRTPLVHRIIEEPDFLSNRPIPKNTALALERVPYKSGTCLDGFLIPFVRFDSNLSVIERRTLNLLMHTVAYTRCVCVVV